MQHGSCEGPLGEFVVQVVQQIFMQLLGGQFERQQRSGETGQASVAKEILGYDKMDHSTIHDSSRPVWANMVESPPIEPIPSKYKLKVKYGGIFKLSKNSSGKRYCFGFQKCIKMDTSSYNLKELYDDVKKNYPSTSDLVLSIHFVDNGQDEAIGKTHGQDEEIGELHVQDESIDEPHGEKLLDDSYSCKDNEESYHSLHNTDNEDEFSYEVETYSFNKKDPTIQVNSKFPNVIELRRALNHHALINEFEYFIEKMNRHGSQQDVQS
ncbi:hypothetical protein Tco_0005559 [Tanacetum coccineum]